jgi:zinc D-Ala-D-Ala carboxypeptidase
MKLSEHFDLAEFTQSQTADRLGIDNDLPLHLCANITRLAQGMEEVRALLGKPITITSGYRSPEVNKAVGSRPTSQHTTGNACDFICPVYGDPAKIVAAIVASNIAYDQVIQEFASKGGGWTHISFSDRNRKQALIIDGLGTREWVA